MGLRHILPDPVVITDPTVVGLRHVLADPVCICDENGTPVELMGANVSVVSPSTVSGATPIQDAIDALEDTWALPSNDADYFATAWNTGTTATLTTFLAQPVHPIQITIDPAAGPHTTAGDSFTFTVLGKDATGAALTEVLSWIETATHASKTTQTLFSELTSIAYAKSPAAAVGAGLCTVGVGQQMPLYTIYVQPGVYHEQVTMKPYISLVGVDRDGCIIEWGDPEAAGQVTGTIKGAAGAGYGVTSTIQLTLVDYYLKGTGATVIAETDGAGAIDTVDAAANNPGRHYRTRAGTTTLHATGTGATIDITAIPAENEYVVMMATYCVLENLTIISHHWCESATSSSQGSLSSPIVGIGNHYGHDSALDATPINMPPHGAAIRHCWLKNTGGVQYGIVAYYKYTSVLAIQDICISDNIIEAGEQLNFYEMVRGRITNNTFRGTTTSGDMCLIDMNGENPYQNTIDNNTGCITGMANAAICFTYVRGWGNRITNNSITFDQSEALLSQFDYIWLKTTTDATLPPSVIAENNISLFYNGRLAATSPVTFIRCGPTTAAPGTAKAEVNNNTLTITQSKGTRTGLATGTALDPVYMRRILDMTTSQNSTNVIILGPNACEGADEWPDVKGTVTVTGQECIIQATTTSDTGANYKAMAGIAITFPTRNGILLGYKVISSAPVTTAGTAPTIHLSIGTTACTVADADITGADEDIMAESGAITLAGANLGCVLATPLFLPAGAPTHYLNMLANTTTTPGTVSSTIRVIPIIVPSL
jgi:hypothetical protein